jgi:hypothetical protein
MKLWNVTAFFAPILAVTAAFAGDVTVNLTTELGVSKAIRLKASYADRSFLNGLGSGGDVYDDVAATRVTVSLRDGLFLLVPWQQIHSIHSADGGHSVTTKSGLVFNGKLLTEITDASDGKKYQLSSAKTLTVESATPPDKQTDTSTSMTPVRPRTLRVHALPQQSFDVVSALFYGLNYYNQHGNQRESFRMKLDGKEIEGYLSDFELVELTKQRRDWSIRVMAKGAQPRTGIYVEPDTYDKHYLGGWLLVAETADRLTIILKGEGFSLVSKSE